MRSVRLALTLGLFCGVCLLASSFSPASGQTPRKLTTPLADLGPLSPSIPLPDLVISNVSISGKQIRFKVKNLGTAQAPASQTQILITDATTGQTTTINRATPAIAPGGFTTVTALAAAFTRPGTKFRLRCDAANVVREKNERNNEFASEIPVP